MRKNSHVHSTEKRSKLTYKMYGSSKGKMEGNLKTKNKSKKEELKVMKVTETKKESKEGRDNK